MYVMKVSEKKKTTSAMANYYQSAIILILTADIHPGIGRSKRAARPPDKYFR